MCGINIGSLVKIFTVESTINYALPWQVEEQLEFVGSGFLLDGRRIVTNSHVVANTISVRVRREGDTAKYVATVHALCPEMDLAILTVASEAFWGSADEPDDAASCAVRLSFKLPQVAATTLVLQ